MPERTHETRKETAKDAKSAKEMHESGTADERE
jgi:hypothetical protein